VTAPLKASLKRGLRTADPVLRWLVAHVVRPLLPHVARLPARHREGGRTRVTILILNAYGMGGTIRTAFNLASYLSEEYDVEVLSVKRRKREPFFAFPPGVKVTALDDTFDRGGLGRRLARLVLAAFPSSLVNVQDWRYPEFSVWTDLLIMNRLRGLTGVLITTRPGLNIISAQYAPPGVRTIGQEHMNLPSHRPQLRAGIQESYPRLDVLAVLTASDQRDYAELFASGPPPVVRMPNAVPEVGGGQADLSAKTVIAAGRLTTQKGFDRLIPAWEPVARAHPDWTLEIYGEGQQRERLEGLIDKHDLAKSVRLMGRTERLGHAFAASSVFVLSSRREGLPMVILEAMSKGLPVVSFDCPTGPVEIVVSDHNGVLVPDGDIPGLSKALLGVIEDDDYRATLGRGALETAARYDIQVIGRDWAELVEDVLARPATAQSGSGR
jgi:glycosyltransferase involved in cell wall biosynthesis